MERKLSEIVLERTGGGRLKMGCAVHVAAHALVLASISEKDPMAFNRALFLRFYGGEFEPKECNKILLALRKAAKHNGKQRPKV